MRRFNLAIPALLFAVAVLQPTTAAPQSSMESVPRPTRVQGSFNGIVGGAVGDFAKNVGMSGGVLGGVDFGLGDTPVSVGGEIAYLLYGTDSRKIDLGPAIPELAGTQVGVDRDNQMLLLHARVRVQPRHGRWRPYVDGLFGLNYIFTTTSIDETGCSGSCASINKTNLGDTVPSFGAGAGVMVRLGKPRGGLMFDVSVRYIRGGEADYLRKGAIRSESGAAVLDVSRSRVDVVLVTIGVAGGR